MCVVHFTHFADVYSNKWGDTHAWSSSSVIQCYTTLFATIHNCLDLCRTVFNVRILLIFNFMLDAVAATELHIADIYVVLSLSTSCHLDQDIYIYLYYIMHIRTVACVRFAIRIGDLFLSVNLQSVRCYAKLPYAIRDCYWILNTVRLLKTPQCITADATFNKVSMVDVA